MRQKTIRPKTLPHPQKKALVHLAALSIDGRIVTFDYIPCQMDGEEKDII